MWTPIRQLTAGTTIVANDGITTAILTNFLTLHDYNDGRLINTVARFEASNGKVYHVRGDELDMPVNTVEPSTFESVRTMSREEVPEPAIDVSS